MSVGVLIEPKPISSLVDLWNHMFNKVSTVWRTGDTTATDLKPAMAELLELGKLSVKSDDVRFFSIYESPSR